MEVDDMRFSCDTNDLNASLTIVSRALAARSPKPILEGILFETCDTGLRLTCTDLALGIETVIPATFTEEGRAVLPGKLLCEVVRKLPGGLCEITISDRMQATIRCATFRTTIEDMQALQSNGVKTLVLVTEKNTTTLNLSLLCEGQKSGTRVTLRHLGSSATLSVGLRCRRDLLIGR